MGDENLVLKTNLGDHPAFMPIKHGTLSAAGISLDFCGPKSPIAGFKDMVMHGAYDVSELALGTYLQAVAYGKPVVLLPVTITARLQHAMIVCRSDARFAPEEAEGKRIGVRSYTQTTGIWVRGILDESYGVDPRRVTWVTTEGAHLAEYVDPPNVERVDEAIQLIDMLEDGRIDAAIFGGDLPKDRTGIEPLIRDPEVAARLWYSRNGYVPVNHILAVSHDLADRHPDAVRALYELFATAKIEAAGKQDGIDFLPFGLEAVRAPVEAMIAHAMRQKIIPRRFSFDDVFGTAARILDA